jgi:hypothetical protein
MIAAVAVLPSVFGRLRTDVVDQYPDLAQLRRSVRSGDWNAVSGYFQRLPTRSDQSVAVGVVAETAGSEAFLQRVVDAERDSSLARTLLGARFIVIGWTARTRAFAKDVSQAQARVFHDYLQRAERMLADATAVDPTNAAAWTERITAARGLGLDLDEARRRYERAAEYCDVPYTAQSQLLQNLCPKWYGSTDEVHAFARECLQVAKPGTLGGAIVANAHVEHAFSTTHGGDIGRYLAQSHVRDELAAAAAQTLLHPESQPGHGWVRAHTVFAFALFVGGHYTHAKPHFAALGRQASPYPWDNVYDKWKATFRRADSTVRGWR